MLLERDAFLAQLEGARVSAGSGRGIISLISGEAGIGKTSLVHRFLDRLPGGETRVLWGACDALFTPRPLGPLLDMAASRQGGPLSVALAGGASREELFSSFLAELSDEGRQTVAVFEDVHWADEATLDLLKFAARRIGATAALLLLTYRDDELAPHHPLRRLLGELPRERVVRLHLPPLSPRAVDELARSMRRDSAGLEVAGGNPFYLTELLSNPATAVPASIRDALLARTARLDATALAVLDSVSLVPGRADRSLLETLGLNPAGVQQCIDLGVLQSTATSLFFRHEIARRIWEDSLEPGRAAALHAQLLSALGSQPSTPGLLSRQVHHAARAVDAEAVRRLAPPAAEEAARLGSHREAAAHLETALRLAGALDPAEKADLLIRWSFEVHLGGDMVTARVAVLEALELIRQIGDSRREGDALRWLSRLTWFQGHRDDAVAQASAAIALLEPLGPSRELAMAYSNRAQLHILRDEYALAPQWGDRALEMAEQLGDVETTVHALTNAACLEPGSGRRMQIQAVAMAREHGLHEHAMRAYSWAISDCIEIRDHAFAETLLTEALEYALARDLDTYVNYLTGWRARMRLEQGRWSEAEADAAGVLATDGLSAVVRLPSLTALGTLRMRRGQPGGRELLDQALELAEPTGELQRMTPVSAARAEEAWLRNDPNTTRLEAMRAYPAAVQAGNHWDAAELGMWIVRTGGAVEPLPDEGGPFRLDLAGEWAAAAEAWGRLGCPYERALSLAAGGEEEQRQSLEILEELGAVPAAALVRRRLHASGARKVPLGPRATTRRNPASLTRRQLEVLDLLIEGLSNAEIAGRLFLSPRTVDHHISAILRKLGVRSRAQATVAASRFLHRPAAPTTSSEKK